MDSIRQPPLELAGKLHRARRLLISLQRTGYASCGATPCHGGGVLLRAIVATACMTGSTIAQIVPLDSLASWSSFEATQTRCMAWGDIDGDGDLDLIVGGAWQYQRYALRLYENRGGTLNVEPTWGSSAAGTPSWTGQPTCVALGDVDGDGDLDLCAGYENSPNQLFLNRDGVLDTIAIWRSAESESTQDVAWGDFDADGDLDLAVANYAQPNRIYSNRDGMLDTLASWASSEVDFSLSLAWGDVDGDGDLDLAVGNYGLFGGPHRLYLNRSGLLDSTATWSSSREDFAVRVVFADMNNDGALDLVIGNNGSPNKIYFNNGGQLSTTPGWIASDSSRTRDIACGDVDGDGYVDLAVATGFEEPLQVYLHGPNGLAHTSSWNSSTSEDNSAVAWADVDQDGDLDLAVGNYAQPNKVYYNQSTILDTGAGWHPVGSDLASGISWGDVDGDGDLDLAVANRPGTSGIYLNTNGTLDSIAAWRTGTSAPTSSIAWADVDSDGDLDLALGNYSERNAIYFNHGGMLDTAIGQSFPDDWPDRNYTTSIAWGDLNGDGAPDLVTGMFDNSEPLRLYVNADGALNPQPGWTSYRSDPTHAVAVADADGDGDLDIAVGNLDLATRIYFNHNGMIDSVAAWNSQEGDNTRSIAWGDADGDGDLDLATAGDEDPSRIYFARDGQLDSGSGWATAFGDNLYRDRTTSIAWGDVDGDGDLDLATGNGGQPTRVYFNRQGVVDSMPGWSSPDSLFTEGIAWADVDGDGDLDLAVANYGSPAKLHMNQHARPGPQPVLLTNSASRISSGSITLLANPELASLAVTLVDHEYDRVSLLAEYSPLGGGQWFPATIIEDTKRLPTSPEGIPYQFTWDTEADGVDGYDVWLRLRAFSNPDHAGLIQWPAQPYLRHVGRIDNRPKISVLYPNTGSVVAGSMSLLGRIWDATNFSQFQIQMAELPDTVSWTLLYSSFSPVPRPADIADLDLAATDPGAHLLRIAATDLSGHTTLRDLRIEIGLPAERAPVVQMAYPPRGAESVPGNTPVVLQFDQPLHQPSIKSETFVVRSEQGDVYTNSLYDYKTRTLTLVPNRDFAAQKFHYLVAAHDLQSSTGFEMGGDYVSAFHTTPSTPSADIDSLAPRRGADEVPIAPDTLFVYYNRPSAFTHIAVFDLTGQTVVSGPVVDAGTGAGRIARPVLAPATYYLVRISDRPTFDGPSDYMSYFITEDTQLPVLTSFTPADQSWLVDLDQSIRLVFNKPLNTRTVDSSSFYLQGPSGRVGGFIQFGAGSDSVLTFAPDGPYEPLTTYSVVVTSHVQDNLGNPIQPATWSFTTGSFHTVGFSGDHIAAGAFEIFFPQGSLPADTLIELGPVPLAAMAIDSALTFSGVAVDLRPSLFLSRGAVLAATVPDSVALRHGGASRLKFFAFDSVLAQWNYLGGSADNNRVSVTVDRLGRYGLFETTPQAAVVDFASSVALIPRVINPRRGMPGGSDQLTVSYKIARSTKVTAKIYSTGGELIKTLASDYLSSVGDNLLQWDGHTDDGNYANDGIYVLAIEAEGQRVQKTFVILNK